MNGKGKAVDSEPKETIPNAEKQDSNFIGNTDELKDSNIGPQTEVGTLESPSNTQLCSGETPYQKVCP